MTTSIMMITMLEARKAHYYQRQSSDESYGSTTTSSSSPSKTHRRTSSFIGQMGFESGVDEFSVAASSSSAFTAVQQQQMNPVELLSSLQMPLLDDECSPSSRVPSNEGKFKPHEEEEEEEEDCMGALELIRLLSFSPPRPSSHKTKKRTNTAETEETFTGADTDPETSSSSSEMSDLTQDDEEHNNNTNYHDDDDDDEGPIGVVDLQQLMDLRMASPSPLVGLQFLPDGYSYI